MHQRANTGAQSYLKTQVESSTPLEHVAMLYAAALQSMTAASEATAKGDLRARRTAMNRTMAILSTLQNTLDLERGGDIAQELDRLYAYVMSRLLEAVARKDAAPIDEARSIVATLADAWQQVARGAPTGAEPAASPPR
jgi:flagellar protein FliS